MNETAAELNVPGQLICWFDDLGSGEHDHAFLSNFYAGAPIGLPGITWEENFEGLDPQAVAGYFEDNRLGPVPTGPVQFATGEHAFAAMKAWNSDAVGFHEIATAKTPGETKSLGRHCKLRPDWEIVKLDVMAAVVRAKFTLDREEGERLVQTGTALLIEGTFWHDDVWGVKLTASQTDATTAPGRNWLGTLLMARRAELIAEQLYAKTTAAGHFNSRFADKGHKAPSWAH